MFSNGPKIVTTGLSLLADASDQLSYPGSGTAWTDVITGTTASLSGSISFTTDFQGSLVTSNSSSVIIFPPSTANFGTNTFTVEFAFRPSQINGQHWILSKNSGSFPNWGVFVTGSSGSGRLVAFFNISSAVSCSLSSAQGSIVTGSNYIVDVSLNPSTAASRLFINSETAATGSANGTGSLSATAPLFFSNINSGSNSGIVNNVFNIKAYTPGLGRSLVRQNYNALGNRFGLSFKPFLLANLLLDIYAGAAAAYSLRQLSSDYDGFAIRVRRSSDNTETNIGFDNSGNLDTVTLLNFCGVGNGFVTTWYDQSGNGRNATQTTAASQPQIVSAGLVILNNTKPSIQFGVSGQTQLVSSTFSQTAPIRAFVNLKYNTTSSAGFAFDGLVVNQFRIYNETSTKLTFYAGGGEPTYVDATGVLDKNYLVDVLSETANSRFQVNNISATNATGSTVTKTGVRLGANSVNFGTFRGFITEYVEYNSNQNTNADGIKSNINTHYAIY